MMTETGATERADATRAAAGEARSQVAAAKMPEGLELYEGVPPSSVMYLQEQLLKVQAAIIREARLYAREDNRSELEPNDVTTVAPRFARTKPFPELPGDDTFWTRFGKSLSAVTLISAVLAILFGVLFLVLKVYIPAYDPASYADIMKIFAGAVAGSTGASVVAATKSR